LKLAGDEEKVNGGELVTMAHTVSAKGTDIRSLSRNGY
jgi:hypothetical protein